MKSDNPKHFLLISANLHWIHCTWTCISLMYLGHCHQILYKSIVPFERFLIFTKPQITCYMCAWHLRYEWHPYADKQINEMLPEEDRSLIKLLRVETGYGAKKLITEFPRKTGQLLPLIACGIRLFWLGLPTAAGSMMLIIWKNSWLKHGTTSTSLSLTEQSVSGNSDCTENGGHFEHQI